MLVPVSVVRVSVVQVSHSLPAALQLVLPKLLI